MFSYRYNWLFYYEEMNNFQVVENKKRKERRVIKKVR